MTFHPTTATMAIIIMTITMTTGMMYINKLGGGSQSPNKSIKNGRHT